MSQIRLILADCDSLFLERLSCYFQKNKAVRFSLELFTSLSKLEAWIEKGEKADLIAISASMFFVMSKKPQNKNIVILSDGAQSLVPEGYYSIHKYMPAENLMKEIIALCAENMPQDLSKKEYSGKLHLVLYIDGSDAANPIAQTMADIFSNNRTPTFYMNLDEFSNTNTWYTGNNEKGLSEMLYYVKAQKENLTLRAETCISKDLESGVEFLKGHNNPEDIGKLSVYECEHLINSFRGRDCYSDIVISRAFKSDEILKLLLQEAYRIYLTGLDYPSSEDRLYKAINLLSKLEDHDNSDIKDKSIIFITPLSKDQRHQSINITYCQKYDLPFPFLDDASYMHRSREYEAAVRMILENEAL